MRYVLLSSIGSGIYNRVEKSKKYYAANYVMGNDKKNEVVSAYIYDALIEFRKIDKIIFIGTAGSNWFLMYEHLFDETSKIKPKWEKKDEAYAETLLELNEAKPDPTNPANIDKNKTHPNLDVKEVREKLQKLKDTMGDICMDIIVLHYGITEEEMNDNFKLLAEAKRLIKEDDNLSFDMTHSFRSLAFYELLALNFFKLSMKNSKNIDFISYGMLEYNSYNEGKTPIIDQSPILRLLEWTKAADEYKRFGTTYLIDELINKKEMTYGVDREACLALRRLGDMVTSNNLEEIRNMVSNCHRIVKKGTTGNHATDFIFKDIDDRFGAALREGNKLEDRTRLYIKVAQWHMEKKRYIASAITVVETMLNYCDEIAGVSSENDDEKKELRRALYSNYALENKVPIFAEFVKNYNKIRELRNKLCHAQKLSNENELRDLEEYINRVSDLFEGRLVSNLSNVEKLSETIIEVVKQNKENNG